ncbi:MAG: choice-of-anchor L domain-containing protein [Bacteroidia bacterium]|nr:choice-of-anchor L domain-containing protein [Bacteroidia bacterium]
MRNYPKSFFLNIGAAAVLASAGTGAMFGQVTTTPVTPVQAVGNVLIGGGVNASNVTYTGAATALAQYTATGTNLPIASGLIISTGNATNPLLNGNPTNFCTTGNGTPGDPLLSQIAGVNTNDAAVLSFDFIPLGDTLKFNYVFGSEEYNEFVNGGVNDVFAFLLTGPDPAGGTYNNENIALLPGTTVPVSINTVNNGNFFGCTGTCNTGNPGTPYCNYYVDNLCGAPSGIACDGFTVRLTAIAPVVRCQTYTIRLAIADGGDSAYDSWVFLEQNSFVSPQLLFDSSPQLGGGLIGAVDTLLYEGCTNATITVRRNFDIDSARTYNLTVGGTATDGVDYSGVPATVTFNAGDSTAVFTIDALQNLGSQSDYTLSITISDSTVCGAVGSVISSTIVFLIKNVNPLQVNLGPDLSTCTTVSIMPQVTGGVPAYQYNWNNGLSNSPFIANYPLPNDMNFVLVVTDQCGVTATDTVFADKKSDPFANLNIYNVGQAVTNESCGEALFGISRVNLLTQPLSYQIWIGSGTAQNTIDFNVPATVNFASGQTADTLSLTGIYDMIQEPLEYIYLVTIDSTCAGPVVKDSIRINIRNVDPVQVDAGPDLSTGCPIVQQTLTGNGSAGIAPYSYTWSNGFNTQQIFVQPAQNTTYAVTVTDSCGRVSSDTVEVTVFYPPTADFTFTSHDFCEPSVVSFTDQSGTQYGNLNSWLYVNDNYDTYSSAANWTHSFTTAGNYNVTLVVGTDFPNCYDTVTKVVTIHPKPIGNFWWTPDPVTEVNPLASFTNASSLDVSSWMYEVDGASYNTADFEHTFTLPGEYDVYLYVENEYGCRDTVEKTVIVEGEHTFFIPNAFSPDNNSVNPVWEPKGENIAYLEYFIFDRWGERIFQANSDMVSYGWNGRRSNGQPYKSDTYVYKMYVKDKYGKEYEFFGHILLLSGD